MEKIIVELEAKTDKALKGIDNISKSVEDLGKEVVKSNKNTTKSLSGVEQASKGVALGVKAVGSSLKAIGIGLVIAALSTLKDLFQQNQNAVDFFSVAFETAAIVVGKVVTAFTNVYDSVIQSAEGFNALGKVISGINTLVLGAFRLTFLNIKLAIQTAQLAWEESFFGDKDPETIKDLNLSLIETSYLIRKVASDSFDAGKDIVNNFGEAVTETASIVGKVVDEVSKISIANAIETARANTELTKSAEIAAATQGLIFEKFDRQAEKLRQVRDEERNSIVDRKKANDELLVTIDNAEKALLSQAQIQLQIANANLKKDAENIEFKVAQIDALRELAGVEAQIEGLRSEQKANDLALDKESIELTNSKIESESVLSIERQRFNAELIRNELERLEALKEIDQLEKDQETLRLEQIVLNANLGTQAKIDAQIALDEFQEQSRQLSLSREVEIDKAKIKSKENVLNALIGLSGAESALGKAGIIAKQVLLTKELLIDLGFIKSKATKTIVSANLDAASSGASVATGFSKTLALGFPAAIPALIGYAGAAVGIISSVKSAVGGAKSVASSIGGSGGAGGSNISSPIAPSISTATSTPPSFNVVGSSDTNQLASAIGGQSQKPIKAFVVSSDVSTSQELDRNIITEAGIG